MSSDTQASGVVDAEFSWCSDVTLADVAIEARSVQVHGRNVQQYFVLAIRGVGLDDIRHPQLRSICTKLDVSGYKNKTKNGMAQLIAAKKQNEEIYDVVFAGPARAKTPSKIQCPFRLLNVVFSDEFAESFACLGDALTRQDLDAAVKREDRFWKADHARFLDDTSVDIGKLQFSHPVIDASKVDPALIVPHDWSKLRTIYRDTRSSYRAALSRITSGQHEDEFFTYCNGQIDALYLHPHQKRGDRNRVLFESPPLDFCALHVMQCAYST